MESGLLFITIIFIIVMLIMHSNIKKRVAILQQQIQLLKKRLDDLVLSQQIVIKDPKNQVEVIPEPIIEQSIANQNIVDVENITPKIQNTVLPETDNKSQPQILPHSINHQTHKKTFDENTLVYRAIQWLIKGNPVAKVAIIILFLGLSYLLKYSIDHSLLSPEVRILCSLVLGLGLLMMGWRLRRKKELYALILQGGAIGVLYFTLFAAFRPYGIIPFLLVFVLLVVVCATSIMFAVLQRAMSLAVIASIGGYLAPILLSDGRGNHIGLFSYYLLISMAILIISFWQSWRVLNLIGFLFTFIVAVGWGIRSFKPEFYIECQIFILANMFIYGVLAVLLSLRSRQQENFQQLFDLTLLFSVPLMAFGLQYTIVNDWQYGPAFSTLGFGLFYLIGSFFVLRIWKKNAKKLALYGLGIGLAFSTLAVPFALTASATTLVWLLEGTAICWVALYQKQYKTSLSGVIIVLLAVLSAFIANSNHLSNTEFITLYGILSVVILFNACLWHHYIAAYSNAEPLRLLFIVIAIIAWAFWIIGSIHHVLDNATDIGQPIILCSVIATWLWFILGRKINWPTLCYSVIVLWPVLLLTLMNNILFGVHLYLTKCWVLSWLVAFVSGYAYLYLNKNNPAHKNKQLFVTLHISLLWLILGWLYHEINGLLSFLPWGFEVIKWSILTIFTGGVIFIFVILNHLKKFPMQYSPQQYWQVGLFPLGLFLLFQLINGLYSSGQIIHWTYIPFINLLEEAAAFSLIILTFWLNQVIKSLPNSNQTTRTQLTITAFLLIILLTFLWGNSIILRSISQWLEISWSFYALWHNNIVQVVLSLIWTLTAVILVAFAHHYSQRNVWFIGAILQALVVLKLAIVDSIQLDGLIRAFVFIGVALLMLIIGYLAPLPPRKKAQNIPQIDD